MPVFPQEERDQIEQEVLVHGYPSAYRLAVSMAQGRYGVSEASFVWMPGAADVNESTGPYSSFIRGYNSSGEHSIQNGV